MELTDNNSSPPNKWAFVAKSSMTFAQIVVTVGLGSQFFEGLPIPWRAALWVAAFLLILFSVLVYPTSKKTKGGKTSA